MNRIAKQFAKGMWVGGALGFTGSSTTFSFLRDTHPLNQRDLIERYTILGVATGATVVCFQNWAPQTMLVAAIGFLPNYMKLRDLPREDLR